VRPGGDRVIKIIGGEDAMPMKEVRKPLVEANIGEEAVVVFARLAKERKVTAEELLLQIVRDWIEEQRAESAGEIVLLSRQSAMLLDGESQDDFLTRVRLDLLDNVMRVEGNRKAAAERLQIERTAMHKAIRRLQNKRDSRWRQQLGGVGLSVGILSEDGRTEAVI